MNTKTTSTIQQLADSPPAAISFDLFGTLVAVERTTHPADLIAAELSERGISVPADWHDVYHEPRGDMSAETEQSLVEHVDTLLSREGVVPTEPVPEETLEQVLLAAFDTPVETPPAAEVVLNTFSGVLPVGILSNCSVPGLVEQVLSRSTLDPTEFDAIVSSVDCGWRKPAERAFGSIADELGVRIDEVLHVGDSAQTDGGITDHGGTALIIDSPAELQRLADGEWW